MKKKHKMRPFTYVKRNESSKKERGGIENVVYYQNVITENVEADSASERIKRGYIFKEKKRKKQLRHTNSTVSTAFRYRVNLLQKITRSCGQCRHV